MKKNLIIIVTIILCTYVAQAVTMVDYYYPATTGSNMSYGDTAGATPTWTEIFAGGTASSTANYTNIASEDGAPYAQSTAVGTNSEPWLRLLIRTDAAQNYSEINVTYKGFENTGEAATCYFANWTSGAVGTFATMPTSLAWSSRTFTGTAINAIRNSTNGLINLFCMGANFDASERDNVSMDYAYVKTTYTYTYTGNQPVVDGNCSRANTCVIYTPTYNATLKGCAIWNLTWAGSRINQWASGKSDTTSGIGHLYTTGGIIRTDILTTNATTVTNANNVQVNCRAVNNDGRNNWTFYNDSINLLQNASAAYYSANYFKYAASNPIVINSTINFTEGTLINRTSYGGVVAVAFPEVDNYTLMIKYDTDLGNYTSYRTVDPPSLLIGRNSNPNITANQQFNLTYKVTLRNESATGVEKYLTVMRNFKNPPADEPAGDACTWTSGNWYIENTSCTITTNYNLQTINWYIKNSTVNMTKTTIPYNYTIWWRGLGSIINIKNT